MPLSLPPPDGGVVRPLRDRRSLGTTTTAVTFIAVVVVVLLLYWLSYWLSCCCCPSSQAVVVATTAAATAEPPTRSRRRHRHGHLHHCCRRNRIRCSYHHRPHLAAAFTAIIDRVIHGMGQSRLAPWLTPNMSNSLFARGCFGPGTNVCRIS